MQMFPWFGTLKAGRQIMEQKAEAAYQEFRENGIALAYDVHDLMIYNEKARKIGKPELTYGYWAEKGKPATP